MRRLSVVVIMAAGLAACGGGLTNPRDPWSGVYDLTAINGHPLPYVIDSSGVGVNFLEDQVLSEQVTLIAPTALTETEVDRVTTSSGTTTDTTGYDGAIAWIRGDSIATDIGWGARSGTTLTLAFQAGSGIAYRTYTRRP